MTADRRPLHIASDRLLLVEGPDDRNLFEALLRHRLSDAGSAVQVVDAGGASALRARIFAVRMAAVQAGKNGSPQTSVGRLERDRQAGEGAAGGLDSTVTAFT